MKNKSDRWLIIPSQLVCLLGRVDPHGLRVVERGLDGAADEGGQVLHAGATLPSVPVEHPVLACAWRRSATVIKFEAVHYVQ